MFNDPIADFIIRIKNAALAGNLTVTVPYSTVKENLAKIFQAEGFLTKVEVTGDKAKKELVLTLAGDKGKVRLIEAKRISKPGKRVYIKAKDIRTFSRGLGIAIISTPAGLMSSKEAIKKNLGGEIICKIV